MSRKRKDTLERLADLILLDAALADGAVRSTRNRHGFGEWMRKHGILNAAAESKIHEHEKTGFTEGQIESLVDGPDAQTRKRYQKEDA